MNHRQLGGGGLVAAGAVMFAVQVAHGLDRSDSALGLVFEAGPFALLAAVLVFAGVWLARTEWIDPDAGRVVAWTAGGGLLFVSVAALLLFSQQVGLGWRPGAVFLTADLVTLGLVAGLLVGLYDAQNRRDTREIAQQRDRIQSFANTAADVNNYGRALNESTTLDDISALCIQGIQALLGLDEAAVLVKDDGQFRVVESTVPADQAALTRIAEGTTGADRATVVTADELPDPLAERGESVVSLLVTERDDAPVVLVALADTAEFHNEQVQLLELLVGHAGTALDRVAAEGQTVEPE